MTAQGDTRYTQADDLQNLGRLGAELAARGYETAVRTPPHRLPHLTVTNPQASVLSERVYVQDGSFRWSWAEPITTCADVTSAAVTVARVLRAIGE